MRLKLILAISFLFFALAFADKSFVQFTKQNTNDLRNHISHFRLCKSKCAKSQDKYCCTKYLARNILQRDATDTDSEDSILNEAFNRMMIAGQQADSNVINQKGLQLIKSFEEFRPCVYSDPIGLKTIGYGHLVRKSFTCITEQQGEDLLRKDLAQFEHCVTNLVKVPLNSNQFSALVSFSFNVGCTGLQSSTVLKELNRGNHAAVCPELKHWNKASGQVLSDLVKRRNLECDLFSS